MKSLLFIQTLSCLGGLTPRLQAQGLVTHLNPQGRILAQLGVEPGQSLCCRNLLLFQIRRPPRLQAPQPTPESRLSPFWHPPQHHASTCLLPTFSFSLSVSSLLTLHTRRNLFGGKSEDAGLLGHVEIEKPSRFYHGTAECVNPSLEA